MFPVPLKFPYGLPYFGGETIDGPASPYVGWVVTFELSRTVWANAQVLEIANAEASAIAVSFMIVSFVVEIRDNRTITSKTFVSDGAMAFSSGT